MLRLSPRLFVCASAVLLAALFTYRGMERARAAEPAQADFLANCSDPNPFLFTSCYARGTSFDDEPAIIAFRNSPDMGDHVTLATTGEVGSTYGLAFDQTRRALYAAAFHRRHTHFGPLGPGGIYRFDLTGGPATMVGFATAPDAGPDEHDPTDEYEPDAPGRDFVGRTGLGDIELSDDGRTLFVMNLRDRRIHRLDVDSREWIGSFPNGGASEAWAADARPFALHFREGRLYHGVVVSGESDPDAYEPRAHVYSSLPDGTDMRRVGEIPLDYDRGKHTGWLPWPVDETIERATVQHPHAMLAGIDFDDAGNMIVGLRDRFIDTGPSIAGRELFRITPGDILLVPRTGDNEWRFDPAAARHYGGNHFEDKHDTIAIGAVLTLPGKNVVVSTAVDPLQTLLNDAGETRGVISSGAIWLDNDTGADLSRVELVFNELRHEGPQGKAQGLGDLALACIEAPESTETPTPEVTPFGASPTPIPTLTGAPSFTPVPSATLATATPEATGDSPRRTQEESPPTPAPELPSLPQTGGGPLAERGSQVWLIMVAVVAAAAIIFLMRRRSTTPQAT